jgi:hypothetical protein
MNNGVDNQNINDRKRVDDVLPVLARRVRHMFNDE